MNQPIAEYLRNKEVRANMPFRFNGATGEKGYLLTADILMREESLHEMYPLGDKITLWNFNDKGDNPDKKRVI